MTVDELIIVNPFNSQHLEYIKHFEEENEINTKTMAYLQKVRTLTEDDYKKIKHQANEIEESLLLIRDKKVKDICHIEGEKDRKVCSITFAPIRTKLRNRRIITLAINYAFDVLGMEEIFVKISQDDKNMIENLEIRGFENLGEEKSDIIFLKEKEERKNSKGQYHENNR